MELRIILGIGLGLGLDIDMGMFDTNVIPTLYPIIFDWSYNRYLN